jgi:hypothetical protein
MVSRAAEFNDGFRARIVSEMHPNTATGRFFFAASFLLAVICDWK